MLACVLETPMLEDADEGGMKLWHLVKPTEEPELPKHRRGSLRERERAKAIPEIYLTRLLSMKVRRDPVVSSALIYSQQFFQALCPWMQSSEEALWKE